MIFNYWKNFCLRSNSKSECLQTQIMSTKFFRKFVLQGKRWQRLQNRNFHQLQQIFAVARWNHPYGSWLSEEKNGLEIRFLLASHEWVEWTWKSDIPFCQYRSSWNLTIWVVSPSHCKNLLQLVKIAIL